jgi:hypothetical protein
MIMLIAGELKNRLENEMIERTHQVKMLRRQNAKAQMAKT